LVISPHFLRIEIHHEIGELDPRLVLSVNFHPPKHRMDPGYELFEAEWLGDVIVSTDGQAPDLVFGRVTRCKKEDGNAVPANRELLGDFETIEVGHHHVEHDQVRRGRASGVKRRSSRGGNVYLEAVVPESHCHQLGDVGLVVYDQHSAFIFHGLSIGGIPGDFLRGAWDYAGLPWSCRLETVGFEFPASARSPLSLV
jgi:hypothetical protein